MTYRPEKVYSFAISTLILVRLNPTCLSFGTAIAKLAIPVPPPLYSYPNIQLTKITLTDEYGESSQIQSHITVGKLQRAVTNSKA